ncbi:hypothetical protein HQO24_16755 [Rhodococcus fascians]|nr:hypothetical protein [Rhodococcus fascians]MBX5332340.1 hypothetical protein [Rhodococcus fascians]MBY4383242.1 hypothetical protein [Rhodococcus fascians]MBY4397917.1 hypothetical protein [Rhodococcus fascians]MBY4407858.1 hypothetical protein [Rhodococcus fascians]MBY4422724.1 hypothetical protein [Rhodococcus fascians]
MSSCRYRWWRSAPETSALTRASIVSTVVSPETSNRSGTTLDTMPPERRSTAVVRAVTGSDSTTSSRPVIWARYAANAAMTMVAIVVSVSARRASRLLIVSADRAVLSI